MYGRSRSLGLFNKLLSVEAVGVGVNAHLLHDRKLLLKYARKVQMAAEDDEICRELLTSPRAQVLLFHHQKPLLQNNLTSLMDISWQNLFSILEDDDLRHSWKNISNSCVFLGYDSNDQPQFASEMTCSQSQDQKSRIELKEEKERYGKKFDGIFVDLRTAGLRTSTGTLKQLKQWNSSHRYSARSGHEVKRKLSGHSKFCSQTNETAYPNISSVAITLVTHEDHCLLARHTQFPPGMYSALAGFTAFGESAEDTVEREVAEEVNLSVTNIKYISSQPWPFPSPSLMLGFHATLNTQISPFRHSIDVDHNELEDARWYKRQDIQSAILTWSAKSQLKSDFIVPPPFTIAHQLMKHWVNQQPT
ncbi:NAD(P)H pyrophosphatase NUDT13, mitochondrial-like isoform X2 [Corticium candelabrum]|uniref:NAD(P)H pyrophosphatase NUDT13, mitochondrial-like isoform X2 n=1 Tax=Corticium candelabrum TaxID=121492 RepID=UPI002E25E703|nr:NAD(P)H pyrophosphatase NUDT13, mitochondrial-like isoform X2 [Corticium candelabrum]